MIDVYEEANKYMKKRIILAIVGLVALIGVLGGIKGLQISRMIAEGKKFVPPPETVTTATAHIESWESLLTSVGSVVAVQGVTVTAELSGKIVNIAFTPGTVVQAGDILIRQDTSAEEAQLRALEATVALAKVNLERAGKLLSLKVMSQSDFDNAESQFKQAVAQSDVIRAAIRKKTIRAPFAGRLGIRQVNLGQTLNEGDAIVSLQSLDPLFVNFLLPQQQLSLVHSGLTVQVTTDVFPEKVIEGKITTINPLVDNATRNVQMQATVENTQERLRPGMFVNVAVVLPAREKVLVIPATSILYAPYSDSVFIVEETKGKGDEIAGKQVRQQFVQLGKRRGDLIAVLLGLKEGETVVSTGVFKLRNGQSVVANNSLAPEFKLVPKPEDN